METFEWFFEVVGIFVVIGLVLKGVTGYLDKHGIHPGSRG